MLIVEQVPINTTRILGFDTNTKLTPLACIQLYRAGFGFGYRYVGLSRGNAHLNDLDVNEVEDMTNGQLGVLTVQHARTGGWSKDTGREDGQNAALNHLETGLTGDVTLACDLEAASPMTRVQAIDYGIAWHEAATKEGCDSLQLYVGAGVPLNSEELFHLFPFRLYWKSGSNVPNVSRRGYSTVQLLPFEQVIAGVPLDIDVIGSDHLNNRPRWARKVA